MGIPKFFRWISERYPLINQSIDIENPGPIFDALYLDMNGIIHNCITSDEDFMTSDNRIEEIYLRIFQYIETLCNIVKPRKLLYMALDGVAPRAKMNHQRQRRFRMARDTKEAMKERQAKGLKVPSEPFDPNSLTAGTEFMARLSEHLKFYLRKKN
jgi:5'-3' exoribonuclease 1